MFHEQCKDITKKYVFHTVKENQEVLREAVEQITETDEQYITSKTYPEVGIWHEELNCNSLTQAFKKLNLFLCVIIWIVRKQELLSFFRR